MRVRDDECIDHLVDKWRASLARRFAFFLNLSEKEVAYTKGVFDAVIDAFSTLFEDFSQHKDRHFNSQISSSQPEIYEQRLAEMLFFHQLRVMGFEDIKSSNSGPDFHASKGGEKFCFEVVTPTPSPHVRDLINGEVGLGEERNLVFRERLLAVTSALSRKVRDKQGFERKKLLPAGAKYIVVMNDSLLLPYDKPWYGAVNELCVGESSLPIVSDATIGVSELGPSLLQPPRCGALGENDESYRKLIMGRSLGPSSSDGRTGAVSNIFLSIPIRENILSRQRTGKVPVRIVESAGVAGFYQITLREDLFFLRALPSLKKISPRSALVSSSATMELLSKMIFFSTLYDADGDLIQPDISPAHLLGLKPEDLVTKAIHRAVYKPLSENDGSAV